MDNDLYEQNLIDAGRGHLLPSYWGGAELRYRESREPIVIPERDGEASDD